MKICPLNHDKCIAGDCMLWAVETRVVKSKEQYKENIKLDHRVVGVDQKNNQVMIEEKITEGFCSLSGVNKNEVSRFRIKPLRSQ